MIGRLALAGMMVMGAVTGAIAAEKPRVPPGRDPGGVMIAIVGPGVDYTVPEIAARLARDGEGEIVGFDLVEGDRRPFEANHGSMAKQLFVSPVLEPQVPSRLAVFRADLSERISLAQGVGFAAKAGARITFLPGADGETKPPDFEFLAAASKQFPGLLFVVPAGDQTGEIAAPGREALPNVLIVAAAGAGAGEQKGTPDRGKLVDLSVDGQLGSPACKAAECGTGSGTNSQIAAARVAALAARLLAAESERSSGAALKAAIVALAKPDGAAGEVKTRYGVIEKTGADFREK